MKGLLVATTVSLMLAASPWAIAQVQTPPSPNAQVQTPPSPNAQVQTPSSPNAQAQTPAQRAPVAGQIVVQDANTVLAKQDLIGQTVYAPDKAKIGSISDGTSNTLMVGEYTTVTHRTRTTFWAYSYTSYNQSSAVPPQTRWGKLGDALAARGKLLDTYQVSYALFSSDFARQLLKGSVNGELHVGLPRQIAVSVASL